MEQRVETLYGILDFAAKTLLVVLATAAIVALVARRRRSSPEEPTIRVKDVSARWRDQREGLRIGLLPRKARKAASKASAAQRESEPAKEKRVFVLEFKGDVLATAVEDLREEITAIVGVAGEGDEVLVRLESGGGAVHSYGLAASQLARLRHRGLALTVAVDRIAASGGYMMACVGNTVLSAPFAILGSIGVVAPVPNVHRALSRLGVDYEDITAGKHKRSTSLLAENTPEGKAKLREQLEETHALFKGFVKEMRPALDVEAVATGEYWLGTRAKELGLVDRLVTSDDYLLEAAERARVLEVTCERPRTARQRLLALAEACLRALV
jgi:serine protease SohB